MARDQTPQEAEISAIHRSAHLTRDNILSDEFREFMHTLFRTMAMHDFELRYNMDDNMLYMASAEEKQWLVDLIDQYKVPIKRWFRVLYLANEMGDEFAAELDRQTSEIA